MKLFFWRVLIGCCYVLCITCEPIELSITTQSFQPLQVLCAADSVGEAARCLHIAQLLSRLLNSSNQVHVEVKTMAAPGTKSQMSDLGQQFPLAIFLACEPYELSWRLYDTLGIQLVRGKKSSLIGVTDQECAMNIAGQLWQELMSQTNSFSSLIAACKQLPGVRRMKHALCLLHPFFSRDDFAVITLVAQGENFAPRWHKTRSVIFYSHHMPVNIRLMSIDAQRVSRVITNFDGQNMTPAIAPDGTVVLALSVRDSVQLFLYQFDSDIKNGVFTQLTHEKGDCISPSFLNNDELVFCRINEFNRPQLGILHVRSKQIRWLSIGSATCPMSNASGSTIAYCKNVAGVWQIFTLELVSHKERQLTHDTGHKDECSWSPCGNYITCSVESGISGRIAVINVVDGKLRFITPANEHWTSPCWSPFLSLPFVFR